MFGEEPAQGLFDQFSLRLGQRKNLKLKELATIPLDELSVGDVELEEKGAPWLEKVMDLPEAAADGGFISEQVQGVVGNKDVVELEVKGHSGHVHADIQGSTGLVSLSMGQHRGRKIKTGNMAAGRGKGLTDSTCPATQFQDSGTLGTVRTVEANILHKSSHFNGVELRIPHFAEREKDLFRFFMIKKRVIHAVFVPGLMAAGKKEVKLTVFVHENKVHNSNSSRSHKNAEEIQGFPA